MHMAPPNGLQLSWQEPSVKNYLQLHAVHTLRQCGVVCVMGGPNYYLLHHIDLIGEN
jgi:hypothetical protein